jgi:3-hydroxy-9,10-secoandrosta-1,3,5(10)-triene-9,17-dione monooxygenase reductase component
VLARVPTSVSVVTAAGQVGVTIGSFTSVSLDPPLVAFFSKLASTSAADIIEVGEFCVNVLAEDQQDVCAAFASRTGDRFASGTWQPGINGAPQLADAVAWIDCAVDRSFEAGDHIAILGRVQQLRASERTRRPLVFCQGQLARLNDACLRDPATHPFDWWAA